MVRYDRHADACSSWHARSVSGNASRDKKGATVPSVLSRVFWVTVPSIPEHHESHGESALWGNHALLQGEDVRQRGHGSSLVSNGVNATTRSTGNDLPHTTVIRATYDKARRTAGMEFPRDSSRARRACNLHSCASGGAGPHGDRAGAIVDGALRRATWYTDLWRNPRQPGLTRSARTASRGHRTRPWGRVGRS